MVNVNLYCVIVVDNDKINLKQCVFGIKCVKIFVKKVFFDKNVIENNFIMDFLIMCYSNSTDPVTILPRPS